MKVLTLITIILITQTKMLAQGFAFVYSEYTFQNKVIVLLVLAIAAIFNFINWIKENKRTDP